MKKNKVRLTESQLRNVIKESVKKVLKESYYGDFEKDYRIDTNSDEWKKMFDDAEEDSWKYDSDYPSPKEANLITQKEIQDYEAMPEKHRHPNASRRIKDYGIDKLAVKKPNSILDKMYKKKYGGPVGSLEHFEVWLKKECNETLNEFSRLPLLTQESILAAYAYAFKLNEKNVLNDMLRYFDPLYDYDRDYLGYVDFD